MLAPSLLPHEFETTCGRSEAFGERPRRFVGASIHWPAARSAFEAQDELAHPFAAIQRAFGATPIRFVPSSPTIVPIVWVPCPLLSHGAAVHVPVGSYQS